MTRPLFEDLLSRSLAQIPEMDVRILADEVVRLRDELATAREVIQESMEARRATEAEGGGMNQLNNEIDRLRARVAELEKQPHANELRALRDLFTAAGRTIHTASSGGRATLEEINDAWAEVCAAKVVSRDLPAPDVVPVPREELAVLRDGFGLLRTAYIPAGYRRWVNQDGAPGGIVHGTATVDPTAVIVEGAVIGERARIGAWTVIGQAAAIGAGAVIGARALIRAWTRIEAGARIRSATTVPPSPDGEAGKGKP